MEFKKQYFFSLSVRSVGLLLGFVSSIIIARGLGVESLGFYSLFIVHLTLLVVLAKLGQDTLLVREAARLDTLAQRVSWFRSSLKLVAPIVLVVAALYFVLLQADLIVLKGISPVNWIGLAMVLGIFAQVFLKHYVAFLRSNAQTTFANLFDGPLLNFVLIVAIGLLFVMGWTDNSLNSIYAFVAATITLVMVAVISLWLSRSADNARPIEIVSKPGLPAGIPFLLVGLSTTLNSSIDTLSIGHLLDAQQLGLYSAPLKLAALIAFPLAIASTVVSNQFSRLFHQNKLPQLKQLLLKVNLAVGALSLVIFTLFMFLGEWVLYLWSPEFVETHSVLLVLSIGQLINALFGPLGMMLNMVGKEKSVLAMTLFSVGLNLILNYLLIQQYGIMGAAIATAVVVVVQNIGFLILSKPVLWPSETAKTEN